MTRCFECGERIEDGEEWGLLVVEIGSATTKMPAHERCVPEEAL